VPRDKQLSEVPAGKINNLFSAEGLRPFGVYEVDAV
jgi:hypothetical protein